MLLLWSLSCCLVIAKGGAARSVGGVLGVLGVLTFYWRSPYYRVYILIAAGAAVRVVLVITIIIVVILIIVVSGGNGIAAKMAGDEPAGRIYKRGGWMQLSLVRKLLLSTSVML
jgi:hypothetical protein